MDLRDFDARKTLDWAPERGNIKGAPFFQGEDDENDGQPDCMVTIPQPCGDDGFHAGG